MKTLVITGARGYIGSALVERLTQEGRKLRLVSRPTEASGVGVSGTNEHIQADLRDETNWRALMADAEAIIHLSARTDLRAAEADPAGDDNINVEPMRALVRAAANTVVPTIVFASTVTIVGSQPNNPVGDDAPDAPCSIYDQHKLACELILREATVRGLLRACSLRLPNVYGYGSMSVNANRGIVNAMVKRAVQGETLTLFGDGSYIRDFTHLSDVVDAFCRAVSSASLHDGRHYVVATGQGHALAEVFDIIAEEERARTGRKIAIRRVAEPDDLHPIERRNFIGDARVFRGITGWSPRIALREGIRDYFQRTSASSIPAVEQ